MGVCVRLLGGFMNDQVYLLGKIEFQLIGTNVVHYCIMPFDTAMLVTNIKIYNSPRHHCIEMQVIKTQHKL